MTSPNPADSGGKEPGIEVRARTVDEAVARGLVRLGGLSRSEVTIEVIKEGRGGVLGFGAEEAVVRIVPGAASGAAKATAEPAPPPAERPAARVERPKPAEVSGPPSTGTTARAAPERVAPLAPRATPPERPAPPPARSGVPAAPEPAAVPASQAAEPRSAPKAPRPAPEPAPGAPPIMGAPEIVATPDVIAAATDVVTRLVGLMGYDDISVEARSSLLPVTVDEENALVLVIRGQSVDRLLAHNARSLYALQFLARLMLSRRVQGWTNLLLDVNDDRARRIREIFQMAEQSASLVEREGKPVSLPPMTPYERRVVHLALRDHTSIATQSIGAGPSRKVTVRRKDQLLPNL